MGIGAKKSKKSKSKRQTLKQKYKVLRKVKEHHRKKRKEAKKLGIKPKEPKDPGIPKQWPFKEELIAQLMAQKERALLKERMLRDQRRAQAAAAMEVGDGGEDGGEQQQQQGQQLAALRAAATNRGKEYDRTAAGPAAGPTAFVDSSRRAFYKEFVKVAESSDVIIEVLDARDPQGCRCLEVERFVRKLDPSKKIVLLLNKIDLVPREVVEQWLKYFREELPTVAFKCSTQKQAANLGRRQLSQAAEAGLKGSECLGADALLHLLKNYARSADMKTAITVGVVGLPNMGKSSLINSLKRTRVAQVGNTPGVTRAVQEVHLDKHVTLLDSPGMVLSDSTADGAAAAALRNCVKVEQLKDPVLPVAEVVRRCPARQLMSLYKVPAFEGAEGFLQHVAQARGKLKKGGTVDIAAAARIVLQDWNDGRIAYYTLPPKRDSEVEGSAAVVQQWGADFNADEVFQAEQSAVVAGLPSLDDQAAGRFFQTQTVGGARVDLEGLDAGWEEEDGEEEEADGEGMSEGGSEEEEGGLPASGSDQGDGMDEGEALAPRGADVAAAAHRQNKQLYNEAAGQFNPHAARAERKRQKKRQQQQLPNGGGGDGGGSDSDYDFGADWDAAADANPFAHIAEDE